MMAPEHGSGIYARFLLAAAWGILCLSFTAAPVLAAHAFDGTAAMLYLFFSFICHQIPERSFLVCGHTLAVCHRCSGIYLGLFLAALIDLSFIHKSPRVRRCWILAATAPLVLDALLPCVGLWHSGDLSRFLTGMLFGTAASPLLVRGVTELLQEAPWRRLPFRNLSFKGGVS
jgi:uncharacterized membrane protein